ncbi:MAG: hypothetical protein ACKKL5_03260 [Candidatus Komeilibacteria bacterium]
MNQYTKINNQQGMIALISILVISAVVLAIALSLSWQSTSELQMSAWQDDAVQGQAIVRGGIEEALEKLRLSWANYSTDLMINGYSCIINVVTSAEQAIITVQTTVKDSEHSATVTVDRDLNIINWQ